MIVGLVLLVVIGALLGLLRCPKWIGTGVMSAGITVAATLHSNKMQLELTWDSMVTTVGVSLLVAFLLNAGYKLQEWIKLRWF